MTATTQLNGSRRAYTARFSLTTCYGTAYRVVCCLAVVFVNPEFTMNTLSFLGSAINQHLLLPVIFALLTTPALAAGGNSTNSKTPDCEPAGKPAPHLIASLGYHRGDC